MTEQCDITLNMMRPCTTNPLLSAFEAMEGTYSFDATHMTPVGTEMLMHLNPIRRSTWDYHAIKAWYFAPALKHYRSIKGVLESGAVRLTDTWKFKYHSLPIPVISPTERIVKATQQFASTIKGANPAALDKLAAIEHLRALLAGNTTLLPARQVQPAPVIAPTAALQEPPTEAGADSDTVQPMLHQPLQFETTTAVHQPVQFDTPTEEPHSSSLPVISQDEDKDPAQTCYNLRSRAHIINLLINPSLIPAIYVTQPTTQYARGLAAANQALQIYTLACTMQENFPTKNFACAILNEETGRTLEFRHLIKLENYCKIWMNSFANKLGRLAQGIRDIPGTNTIDFIPFTAVPEDIVVMYGRIVCTFSPQKNEQNRTRLTVGGNLLIAPVRRQHTNGGSHHCKIALQLCHLHTRLSLYLSQS